MGQIIVAWPQSLVKATPAGVEPALPRSESNGVSGLRARPGEPTHEVIILRNEDNLP